MAAASSSALPRRTQAVCCYTSAMDKEATYCGECGKPLIRCMAAEECGGLLDDQGLCTVCVAPQLMIAPGALTAAKVGSAIALPISIANRSAIERPLFVTRLWSREAAGAWREEHLGWERLDAGQARPVTVTASQLTRAGAHNIEILIAVSSRWRWREESYAFSADLRLTVEGDEEKSGPVVTIGGESAGHGNTIYISGQGDKREALQATTEAVELELVRAEREERRLGLRGLSETLWIPKNTKMVWRGFPKEDTPPDGPILTPDGILAVGRTRSRRSGGPGDVRLLAEAPDGGIDEHASRLISRRHFELYVECNRLILRVNGSGGVRINGEAYGPGKEIALRDGDRIEPLVKVDGALALTVRFQVEHGSVAEVAITRVPSLKKEG